MTSFEHMTIDQRAHHIVECLVGANAADWWWHSSNKAFDGKAPVIMWDIDKQRVMRYLLAQLAGDYS